MSYEKQIWEELPSEETPFTAERMNHIEEGIDNKLDKMVVAKGLTTSGWYRVAELSSRGSYIVDVNTSYNNDNNMSATLLIDTAHLKAKITLLNNMINVKVISQARVVLENSKYYLEIYYNVSRQNVAYISILNQMGLCTMLDFEAPTDTATVLDELSIGEFTTGVEYATNEFLDGKRIYKKRINCSNLPSNTSKTVETNLSNINIIDYEGIATSGGNAIKMEEHKSNEYAIVLGIENYDIKITTYVTSYTGYIGYVTLYYTKN
jgi:hypothetical protein